MTRSSLSTHRLLETLLGYEPVACLRVAYSGGMDSHVLLHAVARLRDSLRGTEVAAIHVNHGLQSNAPNWERHCQAVCGDLNIPLACVTVDARAAPGESPEAAAREARYGAVAGLLGPDDVLLTAHHQDDQVETLLLQLLRGAGVRGLSAMPGTAPLGNGRLGRPLLDVPRTALHDYALSYELRWVEDHSNEDPRFDRNYLRHQVLPVLSKRWPGLGGILGRAAVHQAEAARLLGELGEMDCASADAGQGRLRCAVLLDDLSLERRRNALRYWLLNNGFPLPGRRQLDRIASEVLQAAPDSSPLVRWRGAEVRRYRGLLYAMPTGDKPEPGQVLLWRLPEPLTVAGGRLEAHAVVGDGIRADACATNTVEVRFRRGGERCRLPGRRGTRALKKLLQASGIPPWERASIPLVYLGGRLAAVAGYWVCEPFCAPAGVSGWRLDWIRERAPG